MCEVVGESYFPVSYCVFVWCAFCLVRDLMGWVWSRRRREKRGGARLSDRPAHGAAHARGLHGGESTFPPRIAFTEK